ncbi:sortilin [Megalops cyprinoides]|uniref:sortilin n=1 Tax=Megalops cyprinoides TaxID=118141 RepID=UPI001864EAEE|nr:sortilin [Megalops cyprinoides]
MMGVLLGVCVLAAVTGALEGPPRQDTGSARTAVLARTLHGETPGARAKRAAPGGARSSSFTACRLKLAASELKRLDQNTHETAFHGDDGSSFTLTWVGDGTGVILVLSTISAPQGVVFEAGSSRLYRSEDYGKTFHDITHVINNTFIRKEYGISTGPGNSLRVILIGDVPASEKNVIFTSVDAGVSFRPVQLPFHPGQAITFHYLNPDYLVTISVDGGLWLSLDFGKGWNKVHESVHSFMWGSGITLFFSTSPKGTVDADRRGELYLKRTEDLGRTFTTITQNIFSFGYIGGFLFTSVMEKVGEPRVIYVSSDQGDVFNKAQLPSATMEQFYSVLDGDEDMIFMHVDDPGADTYFGTVYTSDDRGILYSKSLERHLFGGEGKSDFTNITSLRGVYLTNVLEEDGRIRTVISFDRGGEWQLLNKPENAECGKNTKNCNLHIHGEYSRFNGLAPMLPLSDPSAVGLVIAHGSVGDSVTSAWPDVYVSDDGGYTWSRTLRGPHHYAILDSGGLVVAVESHSDRLIQTVKFSTDEGQCWNLYNFTEQPIFFAGLATEPGTKTMNLTIWGYRAEEEYRATWVAVTIDFQHLLTRECGEEDYVEWLAHSTDGRDSATAGCVLGYRETFRRLKKLSVCRNGRDYVVSRQQSPCPCTREDYMCDYGYYRHENSSECVEQEEFNHHVLEVCLNGEEEELQTSGYRKVPSDRCEGGFTPSRRERTISKHCANSSRVTSAKSTSERNSTILVTVACVSVAVVALATAGFLIARKLLCTERVPAYRFSALQLQDDDQCITVEPQRVTVGNGGAYHNDSDEDLII